MPYAPRKACSICGCPNLAVNGSSLCEVHKAESNARKAEQARQASQQRERDDPSRRWYKLKRWQDLRKIVLGRNPTCAACARLGVTKLATFVDHRVAHKGDPKLFWDISNLESYCHSCHSSKSALVDGAFGNPKQTAQVLPLVHENPNRWVWEMSDEEIAAIKAKHGLPPGRLNRK